MLDPVFIRRAREQGNGAQMVPHILAAVRGQHGTAWKNGSLGGWPSPPGQRPSTVRHPPSLDERSAEQHLDLSIDAAELICRPPGQRIVDGRIDPKEYLLAVIHGSRIQRAGVEDRRSQLVTAHYDRGIAHHRIVALLIKRGEPPSSSRSSASSTMPSAPSGLR